MAAIDRIEIEDFLVFKGEFAADFCDGVNILIGGNGTGKTTLMKVLYWGLIFINKSSINENGGFDFSDTNYLDSPHANMRQFFSASGQLPPDMDNLETNSRISFYNYSVALNRPTLERTKNKKDLEDNISWRIYPKTLDPAKWDTLKTNPVYIPVTEMLSHSRGFLALNRERPMPFDITEIDIISKAELEPTREITENAKLTIDLISKVIGGEVIFDGKDFLVEHENGERIPFSFEASGFRKFGLLWKLLRNGLFEKGSVLFWDEPENSLNPELVPTLVDILLTLAQNGVQIFLATHDYNLARHFDVRKKKNVPVMYHNLSKESSGQIMCKSSLDYKNLSDNSLERANENLFEAVVSDAMGAVENE